MDDNDLDRARARIQHVVVLMLENRSFDHLFGFLEHDSEAFEQLTEGQYPNATGLTNPTTWGVTSEGRHILQLDPPHGHASVMMQHGRRGPGGRARMDGFIRAYALKVGGREDVPVIHWFRLALLAVPIGFVLSGLLNVDPFRSGPAAPALAIAMIAVVAAMIEEPLRRVQQLVGFPMPAVWLAPVAAGYTVVAGTWGAIARLVDDIGAGLLWWLLAVVALCVVVLVAYNIVDPKLAAPAQDASEPATRLRIMKCMRPHTQLPVLEKLAKEYAICTRWFSSVPGATWPNRNFLHAATSDRSVDIELGFYDSKTVFQMLDEAGVGTPDAPAWRVYHDDTPQLIAYPWLWTAERLPRWHPITDLATHARANQLAAYSFIEPRHSRGHTTSQHPGNNESNTPDVNGNGDSNDFRRSEQLIRDVYDALRPRLNDTMLVITYDEHGGFFDHVPPPRAAPPKPIDTATGRILTRSRLFVSWFIEHRNSPFHFRRYGVRVPAVVISNWIPPGTVVDDVTFDHSSVVATLRRLFAPNSPPLTRRDQNANTLDRLVLAGADCRADLPPLPQPPDDDGGPTDDPSVKGPTRTYRSIVPSSSERAQPSTRVSDGSRPAGPGAMRVDADLVDQLRSLDERVQARLDEIQRRYGLDERTLVPMDAGDLGDRLHRLAEIGRDLGFGRTSGAEG